LTAPDPARRISLDIGLVLRQAQDERVSDTRNPGRSTGSGSGFRTPDTSRSSFKRLETRESRMKPEISLVIRQARRERRLDPPDIPPFFDSQDERVLDLRFRSP
jgi:hypothetical protein